jgi:hypothetical protein
MPAMRAATPQIPGVGRESVETYKSVAITWLGALD